MHSIPLQKLSPVLRILFILSATVFLGGLPAQAQKAESHFEVPGEIRASDVLPREMLRGLHHTVQEHVVTYNGFTHHFRIDSKFGRFKATGNGMVPVRIQEINAIARLEKMKNSDKFLDGLKESGGTLLESTKNLVLHPVDTVGGFPSGLSNIFGDIVVVSGKVIKGEASIGEATVKVGDALVGFSRNKRELAFSLGVNRFSDNKVLHEYLNSVTWATTGGTFTIDLGKMAVTGPAGSVLTGVSLTRTMGRMMRDNTIPGLQRINEDALEGMGFTESTINRFIGNQKLTPRHQTAITQSLVSLSKAKNPEAFLSLVSTHTRSLDDANMYQAVAAMIAAYNKTQVPITEVHTVKNVLLFRNEKGSYVLTYPIDNFFWTKQAAEKTKKVLRQLPSRARKELWILGKFSDLAVKKLNELGWVLHDRSMGKLKMANPY